MDFEFRYPTCNKVCLHCSIEVLPLYFRKALSSLGLLVSPLLAAVTGRLASCLDDVGLKEMLFD